MYDTKEEANQKLSQTVVMFQDQPTLVIEADGKGEKLKLRHFLLKTNDEHSNYIKEDGWNFRSLGSRLGYSNVVLGGDYTASDKSYKEALYCTRIPIRQAHNTQGISNKNIRYPGLRGSSKLGLPATQVHWSHLYKTMGFLDMLQGVYPGFQDIPGKFQKDKELMSIAFSRDFALRRHDIGPFYLEYKGKDVGYTDDFSRWKIADGYRHLYESLEDINVRIA